MFETLGFETYTAPQVAVGFALLIGLAYGLLAERTGFCLRSALVAENRRAASGVWLSALLVALLGTQIAVQTGLIAFDDHRFFASDLPLAAILIGGVLFGAGMVLTRGCASRLTVLTGTGNLRALTVILVFALTAHATLKGVLSPLRTGLGSFTIALENAALPGNPLLWTALIAVAALTLILRSGARLPRLFGGALIGALVPLAWIGTGFVLYDDFDPIAMESLSFTAPAADTLFFTAASTAVSANFGIGLIGGVILGALVAALAFGSFRWQSFETPAQTGRYLFGAVLMGFGGVLAGGCTVGAGLSGIPTLSLSALAAIASIVVGTLATDRLLNAAPRTAAVPAE